MCYFKTFECLPYDKDIRNLYKPSQHLVFYHNNDFKKLADCWEARRIYMIENKIDMYSWSKLETWEERVKAAAYISHAYDRYLIYRSDAPYIGCRKGLRYEQWLSTLID